MNLHGRCGWRAMIRKERWIESEDSPWVNQLETLGDQGQPIVRQRLDLHAQLDPLLALGRRQQTYADRKNRQLVRANKRKTNKKRKSLFKACGRVHLPPDDTGVLEENQTDFQTAKKTRARYSVAKKKRQGVRDVRRLAIVSLLFHWHTHTHKKKSAAGALLANCRYAPKLPTR